MSHINSKFPHYSFITLGDGSSVSILRRSDGSWLVRVFSVSDCNEVEYLLDNDRIDLLFNRGFVNNFSNS